MDVEELMRRAWEAVQKSGIPEPLQETALKEAVAALRGEQASGAGDEGGGGRRSREGGGSSRRASSKRPSARARTASTEKVERKIPDEATFFSTLAAESGVDEQDLRDVLQVTTAGKVHVTPVTRMLGDSEGEQARTVIALVAGARAHGLSELPVDAQAVRREVERKNCYQPNNFAAKHLGPLKGFNAGSNRNEIVLTSKWVGEFSAAVDKARGVEPTGNDES
jgi:hypothetical protein